MIFEVASHHGKKSEPVVKLDLVRTTDGSIDLKGDEFFLGTFYTNSTFLLTKSGFEALGIRVL